MDDLGPGLRLAPAIARAIIAFIGVLPWAVAPARALLPLGAVGRALDAAFIPVCHRFQARTLLLAGVEMPLCSRCAGIFAGLAIGVLVARPRLALKSWRALALAAALLMVADVALQDLGVHPVWHGARLATGAAFGYAIGAGLAKLIETATDRALSRAGGRARPEASAPGSASTAPREQEATSSAARQ